MMLVDKTLNSREVFFIFVVLSIFYVFPIVHADYKYIDDNWRALLIGTEDWRPQGRVLLEMMLKGLTFGQSTINIFPLPLFISVFIIAMAMTRLTLRYFPEPSAACCLVVLPLLTNPFFLGNLTYQYDGPAMVVSVAVVAYAITFDVKAVAYRCIGSAVLIAAALAFYQLTISVFIGLCVVELFWLISNGRSVKDVLSCVVQRVLQLVLGGGLYFITAYQWVDDRRGNLNLIDGEWFALVSRKFMFAMDKISLLFNSQLLCVAMVFLFFALMGYMMLLRRVVTMSGGAGGRVAVLGLCMVSVPLVVVCVPGAMLFLAEPNLDARNYLGFSSALVLVFYLGYVFLSSLGRRLLVSFVVPALFMFSFCYAYGQVLIAKKQLQSAMATYMAYDLVTNSELKSKRIFYFLGQRTAGNWIPQVHGAMSRLPVLRYILSDSNTLLFPETFAAMGIVNVINGDIFGFSSELDALKKQPCQSVVDNRFYTICVVGDVGLIAIKDIHDSEDYTDWFKR